MTKSQITIDLANGAITIDNALKRLLILIDQFEKPELTEWVKSELEGYKEGSQIPYYRKVRGTIYGSYCVGFNLYPSQVLPITTTDLELVKSLQCFYLNQSASTLVKMVKDDVGLASPIPIIIANSLVDNTNITSVIQATTRITNYDVQEVVSLIDSKLLSIFLVLEKEFGNLDSYDIDLNKKNESQINDILNQVNIIMLTNKSISIGDNNDINKSEIVS